MAAGDIIVAVGGISPSRHAAKFIATADHNISIDAWAAARVAANDAAGTISAWIMIPDISGTYGIVSAGDTAAIEFISLRVEAGKITAECNDGTVDQWEHTTTNVVLTPHKWHHIALVQTASLEAPKIYVDGVLITAMTATLETDNGTWFADCDAIDSGSIGASEEAGAAAVIDECKGGISDVKYWKAALTAAEVKKDFQSAAPAGLGMSGAVSNLTDWWDMDGDAVNSVTAANNGTASASVLFVNEYSSFTSRVVFSGVVVADDICISVNEREGHCYIIKAA